MTLAFPGVNPRKRDRVLDFASEKRRGCRPCGEDDVGFPGVDYLGIDDMLSEDERAVRDLVRDFVDNDVLPIIEDCAYEGRFPKELIPKMAELNLFGSTIHEYGIP